MPARTRLAWVALGCLLTLSTLALAEKKIVHLTDGRSITGDVVETDDGYRIQTDTYSLTVAKDDVRSIEAVRSPMDSYREKAAAIDPNNADAHVDLARWAIKLELYEPAHEQLSKALELKPDHEVAKLLLTITEQKLEEGDGGEEPGDQTGEAPANGETAKGAGGFPLISREDINRIRFEELREGERVPVRFKNDVVDRFIKMMAGREEFEKPQADRRFKALPRVQQALYMRPRIDRMPEMEDDIRVLTNPAFMREFQSRVWPIVQNFCATTDCHGGAKPKGGLIFVRRGAGNEQVAYTNYIILDGFMHKGRRLIDRDRPEDSLLLQYGLPREQSKYDHPTRITPAFTSREKTTYKRIFQWISQLQGPMHPDYRLNYKPPFGMKLHTSRTTGLDFIDGDGDDGSTTKPTTRPAGEDDFPFQGE